MKNITTTLFAFFICFSTVFSQTVQIGETTYNTIGEALVAAVDNDVIDITGIHTESILINKNVTLRGTDPATDIIEAATDQASATTRVIYIDGKNGAKTVSLENLTIRNGNSTDHGGGVYADKVSNLFSMKNVILTNNTSVKNGGGISTGGSNANIEYCTIENNTATGAGGAGHGGGMFIAPNNGAAIDAVVNVKNSVINNNQSTQNRAGGIAIDGNHQYGDQFTITANFENVTIASNHSLLNGGAGFILGVDYTGTNGVVATGETNVTVSMVYCTVAYNTCGDVAKSGLTFGNGLATTGPHFSLYNSIVVSADDVSEKAINFFNSNTTDVINCVLGGLNEAPALIDEGAKNNVTGKTSSSAGIATELSDEGGMVKVLALLEAAYSSDYCTAETGITLPAGDARGYARDETPDAGAFELNANPLSVKSVVEKEIIIYPNPTSDFIYVRGADHIQSIHIYSMVGSLVKTEQNVAQADISGLNEGIYLVKVKFNEGEVVKKIVVE
ncbi:MAG: T9SS type A sorting domain-containing protein [Bacteroidales bacterium]|nr:T9SS type A sorting domain-containing protein [Bacteroidales bacterium]MCF8405353.1 T9SS type A sorting domain-containing protein [Bacteroidales bacterium]